MIPVLNVAGSNPVGRTKKALIPSKAVVSRLFLLHSFILTTL